MNDDVSTAAKIEQLLLPAGIRELDRDEVERSQRRRLQLALGLIASERGYELASIDEIAKCAKLSKSTLYQHFGGREELLASAVDDFRRMTRKATAKALGEAAGGRELDWSEAVAFAVGGLCALIDEERELARLSYVEGPAVHAASAGDGDPAGAVLGDLLDNVAASSTVPGTLDDVHWRALNGGFKAALQDWLRRGDEVGMDPELPQSLSGLVIVAHLGEPDAEEVSA